MNHVAFGDLVISDESGFACNKSKLVESGLPHLRPFNIGDDGTLDFTSIYQVPEDIAPRKKIELLPGDILFNNTNSRELVGKSAIIRNPLRAGFSNHLNRIRIDESRAEPEWIGFWIRHMRELGIFTANATQWVSQAAYKLSDLKKLTISLPTLPVQKRNVEFLLRAESIVRLRREAQIKAKDIVPSLFTYVFGDPATNSKNWPMATIGEVIDSAEYGSSTKASEDGAGTQMIRMGNVDYDGALNLKKLKYVVLPVAEVERYKLENGDLLFNRTNSKELVGKTGIWDHSSATAVAASYFIRLRVNKEKVSSVYLWAFLNSQFMKQRLFATARGAIGQANINSRELKAFPIAVPSLTVQQLFDARIAAINSIMRRGEDASAKAAMLFETLLSNTFATGDMVERPLSNMEDSLP